MKILYVTKSMPFGSEEAFIFAEVEDHIRHGWRVWIAPVRVGPLVHERGRPLLPNTFSVGLMNREIALETIKQLATDPGPALATLIQILTRSPWRLAPRNMAVWCKGIWLARQARRLGIDHIHSHWIAVPATMAMVASKVSGLPLSITAHRYDIAQQNLVQEKFNAARFVRAIDEPGAAELSAQIDPATTGPVVIHMGVALPPVPVLPRLGVMDQLRGIIGARCIPKKGHATLMDAIALASDEGIRVELDVFGDGPLEEKLKDRCISLGIASQVRFHGVASHAKLLERLGSGEYDFAVLPSATAMDGDREGIPVFLMEAMAAGLPVISTANGGIQELLGNGAGLMTRERDPNSLAEAIITIAKDENTRIIMASKGRERVQSQFSVERCSESLRHHIGN